MLSVAAAAGLAVLGLGAVAAPSSAAATQNVGVSISGPTTVFTSTVTTTDFVVSNPSTNRGSVALFTIVVPPGVGKVSAAGVAGPGAWRESVIACGGTANCSSLVLVYASLPLSTSALKPGKSLTASISFTTPSTARTLAFSFIGIGGGLFTTTDTPTLTVVPGDAASLRITGAVGGTTVAAGSSADFTLQTQNVNDENVGFGGGSVRISIGTDDAAAQLTYGSTTVPFTAKSGSTPSYADITLPATSSGTYPFSIRFFAAGDSSVKASRNGLVDGDYAPVTVTPGAAATTALGDITDVTAAGRFAAGDTIDIPVVVKDAYGNILTLDDNSVAITKTGGAGTFSRSGTATQDSEGYLHIQGSYEKADTFDFRATYGASGPYSDGSRVFVAAAPAHIQLDVADLDNSGDFYVNDALSLDFSVTDAYGNAISVDGADVTVTKSGAGSFSTASTSANRVVGRYDAIGAASFRIDYAGVSSNTVNETFSFIDTSGSAVFQPGTPGTISSTNLFGTGSCSNADACADVDLPNGANGNVTVSSGADNVTVTADFKQADGQTPLYTADHPAKISFICTIEFCPLDLSGSTYSNISSGDDQVGASAVVGSSCQNGGKVLQDTAANGGKKYCIYNAWEESVEYVKSYRISATDSQDTITPEVPTCQNIAIDSLRENSPKPSATTVPAGTKFCIDVTNVVRDLSTGDLTFPVYFYDDLNLIVKR